MNCPYNNPGSFAVDPVANFICVNRRLSVVSNPKIKIGECPVI
jgi:hypothetical protein